MKNPPAFPRPTSRDEHSGDRAYQVPEQDGMTLLDFFAAHALTGLLAGSTVEDVYNAADLAYDAAVAMLARRQRGGQ